MGIGKGRPLAEMGWAGGMGDCIGKGKLGLAEDCYSQVWDRYDIRNSVGGWGEDIRYLSRTAGSRAGTLVMVRSGWGVSY